jgi:hypothetical protein
LVPSTTGAASEPWPGEQDLGGMADSARARAERELRAYPRRSDALIAIAANCTPRPVGRWRRELAASGVIEAIEPSQRAARTRTWRARPPLLAIEQGATTPAEVMAMARVSYGTAWRALSRARQRARLENRFSGVADAAAAADQLTVVHSRAPVQKIRVSDRPGNGFYVPPDPAVELVEALDGMFDDHHGDVPLAAVDLAGSQTLTKPNQPCPDATSGRRLASRA